MRVKSIQPIEIALKDTKRCIFIPQIKVGTEWEVVTPDMGTIEAHIEIEAGSSIQQLPYYDLGGDEYAVDLYADDSIFDESPETPVIAVNEEFYLAFYWDYTYNGATIRNSKRRLIKIVQTN